jgi:hypothetical protein
MEEILFFLVYSIVIRYIIREKLYYPRRVAMNLLTVSPSDGGSHNDLRIMRHNTGQVPNESETPPVTQSTGSASGTTSATICR